jgi:ADP-ribose pyrophosphatase YjhB (NUDIX family)
MVDEIIISAGLLIIQDNKILLCHPTGSKWWGTYGIPKGIVEEGEDVIDAAIRETKEEVGIEIPKQWVWPKIYTIDYINSDNELFKKVYYYIVKTENIVIDKSKLQKEEVDWAGFVDKREAEKRILWRFKSMLKYLT